VRLSSTWEPRAAAPAGASSPPGLPAQPVTGALAARLGRPQRLDSSAWLGRSGWSAAAEFTSAVVNPLGPKCFTMFTTAATLSLFTDLCQKDFSPHYLIKIQNMGVSTFACKLAVCWDYEYGPHDAERSHPYVSVDVCLCLRSRATLHHQPQTGEADRTSPGAPPEPQRSSDRDGFLSPVPRARLSR